MMNFAINFKKFFIVVLAGVALTACATQKKIRNDARRCLYRNRYS